jgi:hypothetical protein
MITRAIEKCFKRGKEKKWDKTYWAIDVHETIIYPNYDAENIATEWYPHAKEALQMLSKRKDIELILYTCSWQKEIDEYLRIFKNEGIHFEHVNSNPSAVNTAYGCYDFKPYFNVMFEDKAGFDPTDWPLVIELLKKYPENYCLQD